MLHTGAQPIDYDGLRGLETPVATATHVPIPHFRLVDLVAHSLSYYGHEVVSQDFGVTEDGNRFFAILSLRSPYTGYCDQIGLRNSHDKSLPVGIGFGSRTFVCDNLAFIADHVIRTKHTANLKMRLPGLVGQLIEPIAEQRESQHRTITYYQGTKVTDQLAHHAIMGMYKEGIINLQRIPDVLREWEEPTHEWGQGTAFHLFNAATFVLNGRIAENPQVTTRLHKVIDGVCTTLN